MGKTSKHEITGVFGLFSEKQKELAKKKTQHKNNGLRHHVKHEIWNMPNEILLQKRFTRSETEYSM